MKNLKKKFKYSTFFRVFNIIKNKPNNYLYSLVIDFIFLAIILSVGKYLGSLLPADPEKLMAIFKTQSNLLLFVIIYPIVYYLFVIFMYSIAKLGILNYIKGFYEENKFSIKNLGKFYILNILVFLIFLTSALLIFGIIALVLQQSFLKYVVLIILVPFLFFFYSILNISHMLFTKNNKNPIKKSFQIAFNDIKNYGAFILWDLSLLGVYFLLYNLIHLILTYTLFTNENILASIAPSYLSAFNLISMIFIYIIIAFNRIYFFERIKNVLS